MSLLRLTYCIAGKDCEVKVRNFRNLAKFVKFLYSLKGTRLILNKIAKL